MNQFIISSNTIFQPFDLSRSHFVNLKFREIPFLNCFVLSICHFINLYINPIILFWQLVISTIQNFIFFFCQIVISSIYQKIFSIVGFVNWPFQQIMVSSINIFNSFLSIDHFINLSFHQKRFSRVGFVKWWINQFIILSNSNFEL